MPPPRHTPRHLEAGRSARSPGRRTGRQRAVLAGLGVALTLVLAALAGVGYLLFEFNSIDRYDDLDVDDAPAGDPENYLVVGSDSREGAEAEDVGGRRSDTIMVMRVDPGEETAAVLSLPRDLVVPIGDTGEEARINSAYATGTPDEGRQLLIDTITANFGIPIHHYVEVDFQGFARLVDAVGGVPLFFEAAVRDRQSGLFQPNLGCVTLSGEQALPFVRARHLEYMTPEGEWEDDGTGDLGRITRQQIFMREAAAQVVAEADNPLRLRELIDIGTDSVGVDGEMSVNDMLDLGQRFRDFDPDQLQTYPLPVTENGDRATVSVDEDAAEPVLALFRGGEPAPAPELSPSAVQVTVLNGTGVSGQAAEVSDALDVAGFEVVGTGDAEEPVPWPETTILYGAGGEAAAQRLARHVSGGAAYRLDEGLDAAAVTLVTGDDFTSVTEEAASAEETPAPPSGGSSNGSSGTASPDASAGEGGGEDGGGEGGGQATPPPPTTATTVGYAVGAPPEGTDC
jgi:LCP family protein required for cell wall assembly